MTTRRALLAAPMLFLPRLRGADCSRARLALNTGTSPRLLRLAKQLGLEWADMGERPRALFPPPGQVPKGSAVGLTVEEIRKTKAAVESFGLKIAIMRLPSAPNVILGTKDRDRDIEIVQESIRTAGGERIPVLEYNWQILRASAGYFAAEGRGGTKLRAFDYDRIRRDPPIAEFAGITRDELFARLAYFLKAVVPVAEKEGVRLALHPNDPPVESYRGIPLPVRTADDLRRVTGVVDSPSNGITMDTGVMRETGADSVALIREFGRRDRINHIHFRNVRVAEPFNRYTETFLEEGDVDMKAAMRAICEIGYAQGIVPDHSPHLDNDSDDQLAGWSYAIGYMKALM
ncbi:MAG: mannonate dehydratase [Bryobacteraceae bacterium]